MGSSYCLAIQKRCLKKVEIVSYQIGQSTPEDRFHRENHRKSFVFLGSQKPMAFNVKIHILNHNWFHPIPLVLLECFFGYAKELCFFSLSSERSPSRINTFARSKSRFQMVMALRRSSKSWGRSTGCLKLGTMIFLQLN